MVDDGSAWETAQTLPVYSDARERFVALALGSEDKFELDQAALLIAAEAYPDLDCDYYRRILDRLAESMRQEVAHARSDRERVECLSEFLFQRAHFSGNESNYKDPRNSFLNEVLDRRVGIPITLAIIYIEVARRLGLPVHGVNFPFHFMAKYMGEEEILIDPFFGRIVTVGECLDRLRRTVGKDSPMGGNPLRTAGKREILVRVLINLKNSYIQARDFSSALGACERILLLAPDAPLEIRDRGLVYQQLECFRPARSDLERFLKLQPDHETAGTIREVLASVTRQTDQIC